MLIWTIWINSVTPCLHLQVKSLVYATVWHRLQRRCCSVFMLEALQKLLNSSSLGSPWVLIGSTLKTEQKEEEANEKQKYLPPPESRCTKAEGKSHLRALRERQPALLPSISVEVETWGMDAWREVQVLFPYLLTNLQTAVEKWLIVCLMTCQAWLTYLTSSLQVEGKKQETHTENNGFPYIFLLYQTAVLCVSHNSTIGPASPA